MLTIKETAVRLNVSVRTVNNLLAERKLGCVKIGRLVRISEEQIQQFVNRLHNPPLPALDELAFDVGREVDRWPNATLNEPPPRFHAKWILTSRFES